MKTTKETIMGAFLQLLADRQFDDLSVKDIVQKAAVSRSTFYLHFTDKYQLVDELRTTLNGQFLGLYSEAAEASPVTEQICRHILSYWSFYRWEFSDAHTIHLLSNQLADRLHEVFNDTDYAIFASYGTIGYLSAWVTGGFQAGPVEAAEKLSKIAYTDWTEKLVQPLDLLDQ
ncbi:TetR/AcrR family transcriptional regulator [Planococcus beigongshangi]|uniref:TetR/AcrR family transcriptional regulator n=1 Tax=Planococcus beigongshangi TaxID=2782536 RepID=UPI00193B0547|nr:TetR/AcrR family transcriptional regulator [Planococcus beigongshangi]